MANHEKTLLLASSNPGKRIEFQALLKDLPLRLLVQEELGEKFDVTETGNTYAENAKIKAVTLAGHFGRWAIADDTGLEVDVLDGAPGLHSARLLGPGASDADRRSRLLELLKSEPQPWIARFCCVAALAGPEGQLILTEGLCEGEIIKQERGSQGFGYDPIFHVSSTGNTMAELSIEEKNKLSHRARAINALIPKIRECLQIKIGD
jgi:XTP/dITP diphosphohydrolase